MFSKSILEHRKKRNDRFNGLWEIFFLLKEKEKKRNKYVQSVQKFDHLIHLFFDPSTKILFANLVTRKRIQLPKKKKRKRVQKFDYSSTFERFADSPTRKSILLAKKFYQREKRGNIKNNRNLSCFKLTHLSTIRVQKWHQSIEWHETVFILVTKLYQFSKLPWYFTKAYPKLAKNF